MLSLQFCFYTIHQAIPLDIVYEDEHVLVVNKVPCCPVAAMHAASRHD